MIAAQIVSVPMSVPNRVADNAYRSLILFLIVTFLVTIAALDTALYLIVIRPLHRVSQSADRISKGETDLPELQPSGPRRNRRRDGVVQPHAREPGEGAEDAGAVASAELFLRARKRERSLSESISPATALYNSSTEEQRSAARFTTTLAIGPI